MLLVPLLNGGRLAELGQQLELQKVLCMCRSSLAEPVMNPAFVA